MNIGDSVKILGGMKEFVGKRGYVTGIEMDGRKRMYRVRLESPVEIPGVGAVEDDLWSRPFLRRIRA